MHPVLLVTGTTNILNPLFCFFMMSLLHCMITLNFIFLDSFIAPNIIFSLIQPSLISVPVHTPFLQALYYKQTFLDGPQDQQ